MVNPNWKWPNKQTKPNRSKFVLFTLKQRSANQIKTHSQTQCRKMVVVAKCSLNICRWHSHDLVFSLHNIKLFSPRRRYRFCFSISFFFFECRLLRVFLFLCVDHHLANGRRYIIISVKFNLYGCFRFGDFTKWNDDSNRSLDKFQTNYKVYHEKTKKKSTSIFFSSIEFFHFHLMPFFDTNRNTCTACSLSLFLIEWIASFFN